MLCAFPPNYASPEKIFITHVYIRYSGSFTVSLWTQNLFCRKTSRVDNFFFTIVYIHVRDTGKGCGLQEAMMDKTALLK